MDRKRKRKKSSKIYQKMVHQEISFAKATGYDRETTAVVPLDALAKREEQRLMQVERSKGFLDRVGEPDSEIPLGEIINVLKAAKTVEEIAGVLVEIVSNLVPRVLLMWERRGTVYGFASKGMGLEEVKLLTIEMPQSILSELTGIDLELQAFRGPPNFTNAVRQFFGILGLTPLEILVVSVYVTPVDRWILYADNEDLPLPEVELRLIEVIASRAGALADLLLEEQLGAHQTNTP